jgi:putative flavoprotein involved in K+ transport
VSLQSLARRGVHLLGHLTGVDDGVLVLADDLADNVAFGDEVSAKFHHQVVDGYLEREGIEAPEPEPEPADDPDPGAIPTDPPLRLDLHAEAITSVIWCTGVTGDFSWLHVPVLDDRGLPVHRDGVTDVPGLYFLGFPWLRARRSGILLGVGADAEHIATELGRFLDGTA